MDAETKLKEAPNLILFDSDAELRDLLDSLGLEIKGDAVFDSEGKKAVCDGCEDEITVQTLGSLMPGSEHFYCNKPGCALKYYARTL